MKAKKFDPSDALNIVTPHEGGCWFCYTIDDRSDWYFSVEFDTYFHMFCLKEALKDKRNLEAKIMEAEIGKGSLKVT